jgi:hypothetical protein
MASYYYEQTSDTKVKIYVEDLPEDIKKKVRFYLRREPSDGNDEDVWVSKSASATTASKSFSIEPSKKYAINVGVVEYDEELGDYEEFDDSMWLGKTIFTSDDPWLDKPSLGTINVEGTFVSFSLRNTNDVTVEYEVDVSKWTKDSGTIKAGKSVTVEMLMDYYNKSYSGTVYFSADGYTDSERDFSFATDPLEPWSWTSAEKSAFNNKGRFDILTASRLNSFISFANGLGNAMKAAWGLSVNSFSCPAFAEQDEQLYAEDFVDLIWTVETICTLAEDNLGISIGYPTPDDSKIETGKKIYGHYFTDMSEKLNKIVPYLNE